MDSFTLAEVGDHFRDDIREVLSGVASQAALVAAVPAAVLPTTAIDGIDDAGHTIAGSASLVGATALVTAAGAISVLATQMREAVAERAAAERRLQRLTRAIASALPEFDRLLGYELAGERAAADDLAATLGLTLRHADDEPPAVPVMHEETAESDGFDFADAPAAAAGTPVIAGAAEESSDDTLYALVSDDLPEADAIPAAIFDDLASEVVPLTDDPIDPLLREAFAQECGELLDALDRAAMALETGNAPADALRELFRGYHTLKGSANTVGLSAIGAAAHRAEDALERWDPATIPGRSAATALLRVQRALRSAMAAGGVAPDPAWVASELALASEPAAVTNGNDEATHVGTTRFVADGADQRRTMRIAADQLDRLMRLAGELVVSRSRLAARLGELGSTQRELITSRERLVATVEGFRARNEFIGLDGRTVTAPAATGLRARGTTTAAHFTDLELDRYEEVHILARSLTEITGDIGELQGQVQRAIGGIGDDAEALGRAVGGIQSEITRARMVPLAPLFARLHLAAQDAIATGSVGDKGVRVVQDGAETALDKAIVDDLHAPLLHLVRNAVAHGIEPMEERILAGKSPDGCIVISARQEGGQIVVTVADDGAGLDLAKLHRRGVERGLIDVVTPVDSDAVRQLIFAPGLSTSDHADAVSGRGFGCDVAREGIQRLGGTLSVGSQPSGGTIFTITLPLTLAISRALLVRAAGGTWAVPMNFIVRILDLDGIRITDAGGRRRIAHGQEEVPLLDLAAALGARPDPLKATGAALLVRLGERHWALAVDGLLRQEDVVVSGLGELLAGHPLFAGVTLAGGQQLVPIIDLPGMLAGGGGVRATTRAITPVVVAASGPRRRRVLFVDDSLSVRTVASHLLRGLGVDVVLAVDGEDALARLRQEAVDLVFTDLEMPRMHGYDLLRELRFIPAFQRLPVVIVTSRAGDKHRALANQLGADGYLTKPFAGDHLAEVLDRLVPIRPPEDG